jgi:ribosome maturation factor RimP
LKAVAKKKYKKRQSSAPRATALITDKEFVAKARQLVEPVCDAEGVELVHVEYQMEPGGKVLRLYIDKPDGISLDDCVAISRQVSDLLDIYIEGDQQYRLEVSSPGSNRPLGKPDDFNRFKDHAARIQMAEAINGQKKFKGILKGIQDGIVTLLVTGKPVALPLEKITKARLINNSGEN